MPDTIRQQIVDAVVTRFEGINGAGSYVFNLAASVYPWRDTTKAPLAESELPALIVRDRRCATVQELGNAHLHTLEMEAEVVQAASDAPADVRSLIADVVTAIGVDRRWGGLAYDTHPVDDSLDVAHDGRSLAGARVRFNILFRTTSFDPYTQRAG